MDAIRSGDVKIARSALSAGLDVNLSVPGEEGTLFHGACRKGNPEIVALLLDEGHANIVSPTATGLQPLHCAVEGGSIECVELLLSRLQMKKQVKRMLLLPDSRGFTALHMSLQYQPIFQTLLGLLTAGDLRRQVFLSNEKTASLLHLSAMGGHVSAVKLLLDKDFELNDVGASSRSALICASIEGHLEIAKLLIASGTEPNIQDNELQNAAHWAFQMGHSQLGEWLLLKGGVANVPDSKGRLPRDWMDDGSDALEEGFLDLTAAMTSIQVLERWNSTVSQSFGDTVPPTAIINVPALSFEEFASLRHTVKWARDRIFSKVGESAHLLEPAEVRSDWVEPPPAPPPSEDLMWNPFGVDDESPTADTGYYAMLDEEDQLESISPHDLGAFAQTSGASPLR